MGKKWEKQGEKGGKEACQLCLLNLCKYLPMFCLVLFSESISKCHTHTFSVLRGVLENFVVRVIGVICLARTRTQSSSLHKLYN